MDQIRRTTLMDTVTEELRNSIMNGEIKLGERINENTFTAKLGISRTTFREALRQLEQAGLLVRDPFRGTYVREFTEEEIQDLNELRGVLEIYAAEIIVRNGGYQGEGLQPLYELVSQMEGIDPEKDVAVTNELHIQFHRTLLDMAGKETLYSLWNDLAQQFWVVMRVSQLAFIKSGASEGFADAHREIVDAIATGNEDQIRRTIRRHVSHPYA